MSEEFSSGWGGGLSCFLWAMWEVQMHSHGSGFALTSMELKPLRLLFVQDVQKGMWYFQIGSKACALLLFILLVHYLATALSVNSLPLLVVLGHKPSISPERGRKQKCSPNGRSLYNISLHFFLSILKDRSYIKLLKMYAQNVFSQHFFQAPIFWLFTSHDNLLCIQDLYFHFPCHRVFIFFKVQKNYFFSTHFCRSVF